MDVINEPVPTSVLLDDPKKLAPSIDKRSSVTIQSSSTDTTSTTGKTAHIRNDRHWFKDDMGRTLILRGINVCGSSKLPTSPHPGSTHVYDESFWDHTNVSFVNRPFPLDEARQHFARLRSWGFNVIRLLVPWEALESRRGHYSEDYIDYLRDLITLMQEYDLFCFIDPHQDTWSRYSGGSGAPAWTFEVAGLDIHAFKDTGAAYVHNTNASSTDPPPMVWPTNYTKLACCTMFTLFWAGDTFAPNHKYDGESIQQLLQSSFINAFQHLASRLQDLKPVIGFEVMNEPASGYIGMPTLKEFDPITNLIFGDAPTPLQSFALGEGLPQKVGVYVKSWPFPTKRSHGRIMNSDKVSAWLPGHSCVWRKHGVWDIQNEKPVLLQPDYFAKHPAESRPVDFYADFYMPFVNKYAHAIQSVKSSYFCFVEPMANEKSPVLTEKDHHDNMVFAPHWYDLNCVFYKKFDGKMTHDVQALQNGGNVLTATYFGINGVRKNYRGQLKNIKQNGFDNMGDKPIIFGEVGIPMDINDRYSLKTSDFAQPIRFLDAVIYGMEANLLNYALWNYDVCNDNEFGDHWNGENFSIFSLPLGPASKSTDVSSLASIDSPQAPDLNQGGRVLDAALRPFAPKVAGTPVKSQFDLRQKSYTLEFKPFDQVKMKELRTLGYQVDDKTSMQTEIYVPNYHYQDIPVDIQASHGQCQYVPEEQVLFHRFTPAQVKDGQTVTITLQPQTKDSPAKCVCM
ncbi:glycoside hydrolase [Hesseltinella vesiculosa]|uniref:Glycoside hydrolase n=1 Tax=Hesseltinella vesiculosa TaxID=101127 RepID=A0A1X2GMN8_9FUNG|nr:glycoside hydrolase [Hesseltinella vesiculosa]